MTALDIARDIIATSQHRGCGLDCDSKRALVMAEEIVRRDAVDAPFFDSVEVAG